MITIPTTELIGCLADVLPQITDDRASTAGVRIAWDGDAMTFTAYDTYSGAQVTWVPGEGAEGDFEETDEGDIDIAWGGTDDPWETFIWLAQAKEIVKLFKLPAKLWRFPVTLKCSPTGDRLIIEREDGPRVGRMLMLAAEPTALKNIPDVRAIADDVIAGVGSARNDVRFSAVQLGAFGAVRPHGPMQLTFGRENQPVAVHIGSRVTGFVYRANARPTPANVLRDGAGVVVSREPAGPRPVDEDGWDD